MSTHQMSEPIEVCQPDESLEQCAKCHRWYEIGEWPFCPHGFVRSSNASRCAPMVYYQDKRGNTQVPGRADDPRVHRLMESRGYKRVEMRPGRQYDQWQSSEIKRINVERELRQEAYEKVVGPERRENRRQLKEAARHMTPKGRALAEMAIERSRRKEEARKRVPAPTPQVECMEHDSSNRSQWRDTDGRGK